MLLEELNYDLPPSLIQQTPREDRSASRLLRVEGPSRSHHAMTALGELLPPSLWIVNNTKVIPARLTGHKTTGGAVELLLAMRCTHSSAVALTEKDPDGLSPTETLQPEMSAASSSLEWWCAMVGTAGSVRAGMHLRVGGGLIEVTVASPLSGGLWLLKLCTSDLRGVSDLLPSVGLIPLPKYIQREADARDEDGYQTMFASVPGAVAAPTAGLHFTPSLVASMESLGHRIAEITLHVGPGTFTPIRSASLADHRMHEEVGMISTRSAQLLADARDQGVPVVAVGTTSMRSLEGVMKQYGSIKAGAFRTDLFIYPPYEFQVVDHLLTNFHLPRSSLLALVMAFGGISAIREAYSDAVASAYRFFSYGDAMLVSRAPV